MRFSQSSVSSALLVPIALVVASFAQTAAPHAVLAGPTSGTASGNITARSLVSTDLPPYVNGQDPAVGTSGLINVLQYACGVTIGDGAVHTVSTAPTTSCFSGKTTLAALASIVVNGQTPFKFLTDNGGVTGPACTAGSNTNCFTSSTGAYRLTDAYASRLDIAWLAGQAAQLAGKAYWPAGTYILGSATPLPLLIPIRVEGSGYPNQPVRIQGDGPSVSLLRAGMDFGTGLGLMSCGDPAATVANNLGRYSGNNGQCSGDMQDIGLWSSNSSAFFPVGTSAINMDGILWGARLRTKDVSSSGFNHDWNIIGDHTLFMRPVATGGRYGFYFAPQNSSLYGDLQFMGANLSGGSTAEVLYDGSAFDASTWSGETYLGGAPYAFLGAANGCASMMSGAIFDHLMTEYIGNAFIADDHNYSSGTYTDSAKCRSIDKTTIKYWFGSYSNGNFLGGGRARRASVDVAQMGLTIANLELDGGSFTPNAVTAPSGASPVATFNVGGTGDNFGGVDISGNINGLISQSGSLPIFNNLQLIGTVHLTHTGAWSGGITYINTSGNVTKTTAGDCLEAEQYDAAYCGTNYSNPYPQPIGVVMQSGLTIGAATAPYASSGSVLTNFLWNATNWGGIKRSTGIRALMLQAGSGYTSGTYALTFSGCSTSPTGTVTVSGGVLASYVLSSTGVCTSIPSVAIPSGAGSGSGGAITALWPSGAFAVSTSYTDQPRFGNAVGQGPGRNTSGTATENILLQGLN